jgi:hypothetical protein
MKVANPEYLKTVDIPEGTAGDFSIKRIIITDEQVSMHNLRCAINDQMDRRLTPGTYTQLCEKNRIWMSDTPAEQIDHAEFVDMAQKHVLITGLGIGMVAAACLRKPGVKSVTVIERQPEVIQLVAPSLQKLAAENGKPLTVIEADAMKWVPTQKFDMAWHDIWPDICADNEAGMDQIMEHYRPWVNFGQSCWCEEMVRELAEADHLQDIYRQRLFPDLKSTLKEVDGIKL